MNLPNAVTSCLRNYANFSGRATRSEFWYWTLAYMMLMVPLSIVDEILNPGEQMGKLSYVVAALTLALVIPNIAVSVRRLHDTDRSGWWIFIPCTVIGLPFLIYWYCCAGTRDANRFGDDESTVGKPRRRIAATSDALQPA